MRIPFLREQKGQVAFFVILIFQVLFVFFAMVVNVGLLVHHKINLQNSVDLAAYYGAMKQAEMMNAISHINYQIRQSYKLLAFHHSQLGSAGVDTKNPWDWRATRQFRPGGEDNIAVDYDPVFCIGYNPWNHVNERESYCMKAEGVTIPKIGVPNLVSGGFFFLNFQDSIRSAAEAMRAQSEKSCRSTATINWYALARFMYAYKLDIRNRKQALISLANEMSKTEPLDLDGKSVREGVYKTLIKNLTYQNAAEIQSRYGSSGVGSASETAKFDIVNGFAIGDCGPTGGESEPPGWLSEINIYPLLAYMDADCAENLDPKFLPKFINQSAEVSAPKYGGELGMRDLIQLMTPVISEPSGEDPNMRLFKSSLGFEKNPWCMGYFGVSATATPKIPFSPLGEVKLIARAYAKPFGGRVGPWYYSNWPSGQKESSGGKKTDRVAPLRVGYGVPVIDENDPETKLALRVNYSRYSGDEIGMRSKLTTGQNVRSIHGNMPSDLSWWRHLIEESIGDKNQNGDPLAWNKDSNSAPRMRELELAAIAPDNFDITYYSIEPDFHNNYLQRLQKGYGQKYQFDLRGDLGARAMSNDDNLKKFSIRDQINLVRDKQPVDTLTKLTYVIDRFAQVLTGWQGANPYNYGLDPTRFGECTEGEIRSDAPEVDQSPGSCVVGGRTGYSVKLIDGSFIKNSTNLELGGEGIRGAIKNLPPDNF